MSTTPTSNSLGGTSALGIGSGLDLNSIVDGLMKIEAMGQTRLKNRQTTHNTLVGVYQQLNSKMLTLKTATEGLYLPSSWQAKSATSSATSNVTASATTAAVPGVFTFAVKQLATAETLASAGTVSSTDAVVGTGSFLLGKGGALGLSNVSGTGLSDGAHTFKVTQASTGASQSGTSPLSASITLDGTETITAEVGGVAKNFTLKAGTYTRNELAEMISEATGGVLKGSLNADKSLKLTTADEGSASSLQITGGTGLAALGLSAGGVSNGTDGIIEIDGVANTVSDIRADGSNPVVLNADSGTVTATFSGGLREGTAEYKSVDLGDGKLSTVINAINSSGLGISAGAVQVSPGQYRLQLQSNTTGTAGRISADLGALQSALGSFDVVNEGKNAVLQVGSGSGAYSITSSSNTVSDALPGVTLNLLKADPDTPVTVTVGGDVSTLSNKVLAMVNSVNDALKFIKDNSQYDQKTGASGYLLGNNVARRLQQEIFTAMSAPLGSSTSMGAIGITVKEDGTFAFDQSKFSAEYAKNPEAVAKLFVEGGTEGPNTGNNPGVMERMQKMAAKATNIVDGTITVAIKGEQSTINDLQKQIEKWDLRLQQRRDIMTRQFAAMDSAVANFRSQGNWLSGQIGGLMTQYY